VRQPAKLCLCTPESQARGALHRQLNSINDVQADRSSMATMMRNHQREVSPCFISPSFATSIRISNDDDKINIRLHMTTPHFWMACDIIHSFFETMLQSLQSTLN